MAAFVSLKIICDRCNTLIGIVERKFQYQIFPLEPKDYPEGTVLSPGGSNQYCIKCSKKYGEQLGLEEEDNKQS